MAIAGLPEGTTVGQVQAQVAQGGRFVVFEYTISILIMTFKRGSGLQWIPPGESTFVRALPYTLLTCVAGWWGFPWGPIYSIMTLATNLRGGRDVTAEVVANMVDG